MAAWLIAAIGRIPRRMGRVVVAATAVLLLAAAITALTLQAGPGGTARLPAASSPALPRHATLAPAVHPPGPPVSAAELQRAHRVAGRFLITYLQFAYGRASAESVKAITPGLRTELTGERARVTPAERRRRPRVVSLHVAGMTPGFVLATATVDDRGIAAYRLRFTLREHDERWSVSGVQEG
jgi:hypothetical protein